MAISIIQDAPEHAFADDSIEVGFQSTLFVPGRSWINLEFSDVPADDEAITIEWEGNSVTMTAKATPDNSGNQFPSTGSPLADYVDAVREHFLQNETFLQNTNIVRTSTGAVESIIIQFPFNEVITITESNNLSNVTVTITNFAGLAFDNLRANARVYLLNSNKESYTGALHAIYNVENTRAVLDVAQLLNLSPHTPDTDSIAGAWAFDTADKAFGEYYFRYADKYGYPAVAEALQKSATKYLVAGSVDNATKVFFSIFFEWVCHNYATIGSAIYPKIVTQGQPDYFYYYAKNKLTNYSVRCLVEWSDGTTEQHILDADVTLQKNKMYWFPCGYNQCNLGSLQNGDEIITHYQFGIGTLDDPARADSWSALAGVHYEIDLDAGRDWNTYLLCFNGVGGCESVGFMGKTSPEIEVESQTIELADSTRQNFQPRTRKRLELNSGYFDAPYIRHMQQLLTGDIWLIDMENNRFIPLRLLI